jgi:hypothetical protein
MIAHSFENSCWQTILVSWKMCCVYGKPCFCSNLVLIRVPDFFEYFSEKKSKFDKLQIMWSCEFWALYADSFGTPCYRSLPAVTLHTPCPGLRFWYLSCAIVLLVKLKQPCNLIFNIGVFSAWLIVPPFSNIYCLWLLHQL